MNQEELKQRLIELVGYCSCRHSPPCTGECFECINVDMRDRQIEYIADHLIANGVTIRERGEWIHLGGDEWCCPACRNVITTEGSWEKPTQKFCSECGADLRGVKDE